MTKGRSWDDKSESRQFPRSRHWPHWFEWLWLLIRFVWYYSQNLCGRALLTQEASSGIVSHNYSMVQSHLMKVGLHGQLLRISIEASFIPHKMFGKVNPPSSFLSMSQGDGLTIAIINYSLEIHWPVPIRLWELVPWYDSRSLYHMSSTSCRAIHFVSDLSCFQLHQVECFTFMRDIELVYVHYFLIPFSFISRLPPKYLTIYCSGLWGASLSISCCCFDSSNFDIFQ